MRRNFSSGYYFATLHVSKVHIFLSGFIFIARDIGGPCFKDTDLDILAQLSFVESVFTQSVSVGYPSLFFFPATIDVV